jgi:DNA-binding response OmpR family regulator
MDKFFTKKEEKSSTTNILFVEDDETIASGLTYALEQIGYYVFYCKTVEEAKKIIYTRHLDLAILDMTLPDGTGIDVLKEVKRKTDAPSIFLTVVDDEANTVKALENGAEDYINKPFRLNELIARIHGVLERSFKYHEKTNVTRFKFGLVDLDTNAARVYYNGEELYLSATEYRLLLVFATHRGQILTRNQILEFLWDEAGNFINDNTLTVYIKRLREKVDLDEEHPLIETVRGIGYRITDQE